MSKNAEHGLGMYSGQKYIRDNLIEKLNGMEASGALKEAIDAFMATKDSTKENSAKAADLIAALEKDGSATAKEILEQKD